MYAGDWYVEVDAHSGAVIGKYDDYMSENIDDTRRPFQAGTSVIGTGSGLFGMQTFSATRVITVTGHVFEMRNINRNLGVWNYNLVKANSPIVTSASLDVWEDTAAVELMHNFEHVLDYYSEHLNRVSYNSNGHAIEVIVRHPETVTMLAGPKGRNPFTLGWGKVTT